MRLTAVVVLVAGLAGVAAAADVWQELEPGLEVGRFASGARQADPDGDLTVLRIDPALFDLKLLVTDRQKEERGQTLPDWCAGHDLLAAINAGMYQADHRTHVGFCQVDGRVVNGFRNDYLSVAAFSPRDPADPPFRIFDLDEIPLARVQARYRTVVQNLRLIKRPGENRWQPAADKWREAALAEDAAGRALFVYCRTPRTMHDFNRILLALPLDVVAAQHLEGRHQARFLVSHPAWTDDGPGSQGPGPVLPNIFGVARRDSSAR